MLIMYIGIAKSKLNTSLFPARDANLPWASSTEPPAPVGETTISVKSELGIIDYEFFLDSNNRYPYVNYSFYFIDSNQPYKLVDLTRYSNVSFKILCDPKNVLLFVVFSFDEKVTNIIRPVTRRVSSTAFSCNNQWSTVTIDFDKLTTPHWWLDRNNYELSDNGYQLNKSMAVALTNSHQSPMNMPLHVRLTDVQFLGTEPGYIYAAVVLSAFFWILFFAGLFRWRAVVQTRELEEKVRLDQPLMAYKKLSIEPQKDKEKSAVLRLLATDYANPDLNLESATVTLGINRTKINDILKEELGFTFTTYLNKLRLTEAARLLSETPEASVSEIAYSVGYNNTSYFNKLFKQEYGCTPKTFKVLRKLKEND